ncbi:MAG: 16S rRNA (adenine(1518)-N(6)/adenine(1519)-N(6))-dimethyltransferase RsmA [bacterium]|nr:16S rRNA (adenine(1518)-N(6)/adenine(1519)-N(6))-dimethyltransferase RsmA [bacterium]
MNMVSQRVSRLEGQTIGDLTDLNTLRSVLRRFGMQPTKKLSQNFLVDREVLEEIVETANLTPQSNVLEVGAGTGVLTRELVQRAGHVVAVEVDTRATALLKETVGEPKNLTLISADVMRLTPEQLRHAFGQEHSRLFRYDIVANLPYHLTSHFLQHFLEFSIPPRSFTLLLQREVAERIAAKPGDMSLLALSVQVYGEPTVVATVPKTAFWPVPTVDSAILRIDRHEKPRWPDEVRDQCFRLAKVGFAHRRKTLVNSLRGGLRLPADQIVAAIEHCKLQRTVRAQELRLEDWSALAETLPPLSRPSGTLSPR